MAKFIELTESNGTKHLVNVEGFSNVFSLTANGDDRTRICFMSPGLSINVVESYDEIVRMINGDQPTATMDVADVSIPTPDKVYCDAQEIINRIFKYNKMTKTSVELFDGDVYLLFSFFDDDVATMFLNIQNGKPVFEGTMGRVYYVKITNGRLVESDSNKWTEDTDNQMINDALDELIGLYSDTSKE